MNTSGPELAQRGKSFFGHPRGLANLFGIEIWERFSFYGMQTVLTYYLYFSVTAGGLGLAKGTATSIVGAYGGLVFLSTILAAWVADRLLGSERTLFYSAVLVMLGHMALAVLPGFSGVIVGLLCVALGSGGVKANATSLLGGLYSAGDQRRDAGFSLFYMGINTGAFVGPLLTGLARTNLGFHYGFGLAAIGMAVGLVQYSVGRSNLRGAGRGAPNPLPRSRYPGMVGLAAVVVVLALAGVFTGVLRAGNLAKVVTIITAVASVIYFTIMISSRKINSTERKRVLSFIPMFIASFGFFSLFQQQFTVLEIYADERVNHTVFGFSFPPEWFNSVNPIFIITLAPLFAALWTKLGDRQPSTPIKFAMGVGIIGVGFLLFLPWANSGANAVPALAPVLILLVFTMGELCLSPVGLSLSTKLAPKAFTTQMVSLNFLSVALGTSLAGSLAHNYDTNSEYAYFGVLGGAALVLGALIAIGSPWIRRLMSGVR